MAVCQKNDSPIVRWRAEPSSELSLANIHEDAHRESTPMNEANSHLIRIHWRSFAVPFLSRARTLGIASNARTKF